MRVVSDSFTEAVIVGRSCSEVEVRRTSLQGAMRSPQELQRAVDSMVRMRAVESPPDASGSRRIWHHGASGAELLTEIDARGRVLRQELTMFDEVVRWDRDQGFERAGLAVSAATAAPGGGLNRAAGALAAYAGQDRFLQHLKDQLAAEVRGGPAPAAGPPAQGPVGARPWTSRLARGRPVALALAGIALAAVLLWLLQELR
jgi:hypothetical protein